MANKSHLKFLSEKQLSEIKDFKYNYGFDSNKDDEDAAPKNYFRLATSLRADLIKFDTDVTAKYELKDKELNIPTDIDYIEIAFQGVFEINKYFKVYYNDLGLEASAFYDFAKKGLFAIINRERFQAFITDVNNFIQFELEHNQ